MCHDELEAILHWYHAGRDTCRMPFGNGGTASGWGANTSAAITQPVTGVTTSLNELNYPNSQLARRSVYFDLDSFDVKDIYLPLLRTHASYPRNHPAQHVLIQGNTDERGTDECNHALGVSGSQF